MDNQKVRQLQTRPLAKGMATALAKINSRPSIRHACLIADRLITHKKIYSSIKQRETGVTEFSDLVNKALRTLL